MYERAVKAERAKRGGEARATRARAEGLADGVNYTGSPVTALAINKNDPTKHIGRRKIWYTG